MYLRWKRREYVTCGNDPPDYGLVAVLVESERRQGKPRQKVIAHLGVIAEGRLHHVGYRIEFWSDIESRLDALHLGDEQRHKIEQSITSRVARPTREELEERTRLLQELARECHKL
jgi:hypothetical protein